MVAKFNSNANTLKIVLLIMNTLATVTNQVVYLTLDSAQSKAKFAVSVIAVFGGIYISFALGIIIGIVVRHKNYIKNGSYREFYIVLTAQMITGFAGVAYITGDRILPLLSTYGPDINCKESCIEIAATVGTALIIFSLLLFRLTPLFVFKLHVISNTYPHTEVVMRSDSMWHSIVESMALIVEIDAWFSIIADIPLESPHFCPSHQLIVTWILYVLIIITWLVLLLSIVLPGAIKLFKREIHHLVKVFVFPLTLVVIIWFSVAILLLSANVQPIGCLYGCDIVAGNFSTQCNQVGYYGSRIAMLSLVMLAFMGIGIVLIHIATNEHSATIITGHEVTAEMNDEEEIIEDVFQ